MLSLRITEVRQQKNLTQADVAQRLGITRQTYSSYETGKRQMNFETLCMLADFYKLSADYLLGRQDALPSFLSDEERDMVAQYRMLDEYAKETIKNSLAFECSRKAKDAKKSAM